MKPKGISNFSDNAVECGGLIKLSLKLSSTSGFLMSKIDTYNFTETPENDFSSRFLMLPESVQKSSISALISLNFVASRQKMTIEYRRIIFHTVLIG